MDSKKRINKFLSEAGFCSRRAADTLLKEKRVTINGNVAELGSKVTSDDLVMVDGKSISTKDILPIYIAFNKPIGIVCQQRFIFCHKDSSWLMSLLLLDKCPQKITSLESK